MSEDISDQIAAIIAMLEQLERDEDKQAVRDTLTRVGAALAEHWESTERTNNKPFRGVGYEIDEAMIVASLPWFADNMSAAIRAHFPKYEDDEVHNLAQRIRGRRKEIEGWETSSPHETSANWLGDLSSE